MQDSGFEGPEHLSHSLGKREHYAEHIYTEFG
jgi:hypothetical protein